MVTVGRSDLGSDSGNELQQVGDSRQDLPCYPPPWSGHGG